MIDRNATIENHGEGGGEAHTDAPPGLAESLERRVERLEDAVAALQDTQLVEERITERVVQRMNPRPSQESTGIVDAGQHRHVTNEQPAFSEEPAAPPPGPRLNENIRRSWAIVEVFREIKTMLSMFFDYRFRTSWSAFFALMLVAYVLVSQWLWTLWSGVPIIGLLTGPMSLTIVGSILDKAVDLVLALFAYKILSREMRRYKEVISGA